MKSILVPLRYSLPIVLIFTSLLLVTSCESEAEKKEKKRRQQEAFEQAQQTRLLLEELNREQKQLESELEQVRNAERERIREENNLYRNNKLSTGALPYVACFGSNSNCSNYNCSEISVKASNDADCVVSIKKDGKVVRHAYIQKGRTHTFDLPDGTYQPFFYSGNGWNPNKLMPSSSCDTMRGGFIADESTGKDAPQQLNGHILSYELVPQINGNFSTRPSSPKEAF